MLECCVSKLKRKDQKNTKNINQNVIESWILILIQLRKRSGNQSTTVICWQSLSRPSFVTQVRKFHGVVQCTVLWSVAVSKGRLGASHKYNESVKCGLVLLTALVSRSELFTLQFHENKHPQLANSPQPVGPSASYPSTDRNHALSYTAARCRVHVRAAFLNICETTAQ